MKYNQITFDQDPTSIITTINALDPAVISFGDKIKAATAYCLGLKERWSPKEPNSFVWSCGGFNALCKIKADAVMARSTNKFPPRSIVEEVCQ